MKYSKKQTCVVFRASFINGVFIKKKPDKNKVSILSKICYYSDSSSLDETSFSVARHLRD